MSWQDLQKEIKILQSKIDYKPDVIVGITRGGLIPAIILSKYLDVKVMFGLAVKKIDSQRKVATLIDESISGKNILLVEDLLETGRSLETAKRYLEGKGAVVRTACLYVMESSEIIPDYFIKKVDRSITFPWE